MPNQCARVECSKIERVDIELAVEFGVCGQRHLETTVEEKSIDMVRANPSAYAVACFEHRDRDTGTVECDGA
jgi:hypothetical protein